MLIDDADAIRLRTLIRANAISFESEYMSSVANLVWRRVRRPRGTLHNLTGVKASRYFLDCINYVETEALAVARRYCSAEWLWLLRRVRQGRSGSLPSLDRSEPSAGSSR
jgi:hypothetical protein